jgi:hypothetical protein
MSQLVRASEPFAHELNGYAQVVDPGDLYPDDDPVVLAYPGNFVYAEAVEQATSAPGEKRTARRVRKATKPAAE